MKARELMTRKFEVVHADADVEEVARKLETSNAGILPVCKDGLLVGMVTHDDLAVHVTAGRQPTRVADVIAPDILYCFESTDVTEAANLMRENRVPFLPVLRENKTVVGVLALKDIPGEKNSKKTRV